MPGASPPPRGTAALIGLVFVVLGVAGFWSAQTDPGTAGGSMSVARLAPLLFALVGLGVAGFEFTGEVGARALGWAIAVVISGGLTILFAWAALGPGERTVRISGSAVTGEGGEIFGRVFSGAFAVLTGLLFVAAVVKAVREISRGKS